MAAYAGPDSELAPDAKTISQFMAWWFQFCNRGQIEIGWLDKDGKGLIHFVRFEIGSQEIVPTIVEANLVPGQAIYFRASTVNTTSGFTTDANFVQAPGPWGDIDTPEQMEQAKSVQTIVRPNGSVITGMTPHMRAQSFFRVSEPIVNPTLVRSLNRRIHKLYGGDPAVVNPTRLMRLPGTIAWPWKPGRVPELTGFVQSPERATSYPLSLLTSQLPAEEDAAAKPAEAAPGMRATLNSVAELIRLIQGGNNWHNNMLRLTAHWIGRGWSDAEIMAACECFTLPGYTLAQTRAEVAKAVQSGRSRWGVPDQEHSIGSDPEKPFPDQVVDPWDALQAPEFPIHALPPLLRAFVEARARVMGADPCAIAWSCLSACSAAIDGRVRLRVKKHDTWTVPPAIWVVLVGRSSAKKSPIIAEAWRPLDEIQKVAMSDYAFQLRRWKELPKDEQKGSEPTKPRRLLSHDATMEGLQEILGYQDRGIGVVRDELAGFIGSMDKYSAGRGGAADRAFWLQTHNGGSHVVDRVGRGTTAINNLLVTICGGIQPDRLAKFSDLADDGLWQRFIPIIVKPAEMGTDEAPSDIVHAYAAQIEGILARQGEATVHMSDGAHAVRAELEQYAFNLERSEPLGGKFASFTGKLPGMFGRLCLVLSYLDPSGLGVSVSEANARAAFTLIKYCVVPHAAAVYMEMGGDGASVDTTKAIAGYILTKKLLRVLVSDLTRNVRVCRNQTMQEVARMVSPLIAGGWLTPETDLPGNKAWLVNPTVHTTFAERARVEAGRRTAIRELIAGGEDDE